MIGQLTHVMHMRKRFQKALLFNLKSYDSFLSDNGTTQDCAWSARSGSALQHHISLLLVECYKSLESTFYTTPSFHRLSTNIISPFTDVRHMPLMWVIRFLLSLVGCGSIISTQNSPITLAKASDTSIGSPAEYPYIKAICLLQDKLRTHHQHSGALSKIPGEIFLFDVLGLDPNQKPFHPIVDSLYPEGKNGKEAKEAIENKRVDWKKAARLLGNRAMSDQEAKDALFKAANSSTLLWVPTLVLDRLTDMVIKDTVHKVLSNEETRLMYQWKFLPLIERPGAVEKFCDDVLEEADSHDEL